ncbi:MAG: branched-chain amino acid ABC transporter permease [Candidatus Geothermincolia bacterium]
MDGQLTRHQDSDMRSYRTLFIVAVFILLIPAWAKFIPGEVLHMDIVNVMVLAGVYACAVIGLNLLIGYAGQISLGHAAFFGIGAYTTAILCTRVHWFPTWLGIIAGTVLAGAVGWLVGKPVLRLKGNYLAMATLGLGEIAFILFQQVKGLTGGTVGILNIPPLSIFGLKFDTDLKYFFVVWIIVMLLMLITINLIRSRVGRALRALHSSEVAADAMGVNTGRYKTNVFVLSAAFAGLGGSLFALFQKYINPESFVLAVSILFVTMVVVGGMGNIWGGLIGVIILTFLPSVIQALPQWIPGLPSGLSNFSNYQLVLYGLLLILFMMFLPKGVAFGLSRAAEYTEARARHLRDRRNAKKMEGR